MWYYAENSEQHGPVTKEELIAKLQSGELTRDTLVWTNNMRTWQKACDVQELSGALQPAPQVSVSGEPSGQPIQSSSMANFQETSLPQDNQNGANAPDAIKLRPVGGGVGTETAQPQNNGGAIPQPAMLTCQCCGRPVAPSLAINYQGTIVCPECKPQYLQNLYAQHGTNLADYPQASFWQRVGALLIDGFIVGIIGGVVGGVLGFIEGFTLGSMGCDPDVIVFISQLLNFAVGVIIGLSYQVFFLSKYAATPGKMVLGLKVLHNGENPSVGLAIGRYFATWLSWSLCCIGYLMMLFRDDNKTLHDMICDTVVVSTK